MTIISHRRRCHTNGGLTQIAVIAVFALTISRVSLAQQQSRDLVEVQRFGWSEMPDTGSTRLSIEVRRSMGAVLARPAAVAEGPDGSVYVLDSDFRKIVVFDSKGSLLRVILGGYGQGPGEFDGPRDITITERGEIAVIDQRLRRLTLFDPTGKLMWSRAVRVPEPMRVAAAGDKFYIMGWYRKPRRAIVVIDSTGVVRDSLYSPTDPEYALADAGSMGSLTRSVSGDVLFATGSPGVWHNLRTSTKHGTDLVPGQRPLRMRYQGDVIDYTPAVASRIGQWPSGATAFYYTVHDSAALAKGRIVGLNQLAVVSGAEAPTIVPLGNTHNHALFAVSRTEGDFYLAVNEPFPQVIRYRLRRPGVSSSYR